MFQEISEPSKTQDNLWKYHPKSWLILILIFPLLIIVYYNGLDRMVMNWFQREEYSYGILIPFVSLYLIYQKKDELSKIPDEISWGGFALTIIGLILYYLGEISAITIITQYSFIITLAGLCYSLIGLKAFKEIWPAFELYLGHSIK